MLQGFLYLEKSLKKLYSMIIKISKDYPINYYYLIILKFRIYFEMYFGSYLLKFAVYLKYNI